ncbi:MAG: hypothetical protein WAQ27_05620 [Candidatus Microsaccharimonas sp.]
MDLLKKDFMIGTVESYDSISGYGTVEYFDRSEGYFKIASFCANDFDELSPTSTGRSARWSEASDVDKQEPDPVIVFTSVNSRDKVDRWTNKDHAWGVLQLRT